MPTNLPQDLLALSPETIEREIQMRGSEVERLRAESRILQAELDRRATQAKTAAEVARINKMSPTERLALLQAIGATQSIDVAPVRLSAAITPTSI